MGDSRESPALDVAHLLIVRGAAVTWSDPFVARAETRGGALPHLPLDEALAAGIDCAVITTHHRGVDYADVVERAPLVVDTRNALAGVDAAHVFRL